MYLYSNEMKFEHLLRMAIIPYTFGLFEAKAYYNINFLFCSA